MTTENKGQGNSAAKEQSTPITSLDAAAFTAATSQPKAADKPADAGKHAADAAVDAVNNGQDKQGEGDGQAKVASPDFKNLRSLKPDDIEKMLASDSDDIVMPDKKGEGEGEGATTSAEGKEGEPAKTTPMIPKPRLDEVLNKNKEQDEALEAANKRTRELEAELQKEREEKAYLKGLAEGKGQPGSDKKEPTAQDQVAEIDADLNQLEKDRRAAIKAVAKKFDDGEIKLEEYEEQKANLETQAGKIKNVLVKKRNDIVEQSQPQPKYEEVAANINADPRLQKATDALMQQHPWLNYIPIAAAEMLTNIAQQEMQKDGLNPNVADVETTWQLRQYIARVGKSLGYDRIAAAPAQGDQGKANGTANGKQPSASDRSAKLDLAAAHPPAPGLGGTAAPTSTLDGINFDTVSVRDLSKQIPLKQIEDMLLAG